MSHKIGIDFGTTNSTISYVEDGGGPTAFRYPGPDGYEYIPSCVVYDPDGDVRIGRAALDFVGDPDAVFCNNLKMILPQADEGRVKHQWPAQKDPEQAISSRYNEIESQLQQHLRDINAYTDAIDAKTDVLRRHFRADKDLAGRFSGSSPEARQTLDSLAEAIETDLERMDRFLEEIRRRIQETADAAKPMGIGA
jgi:hypothetical protein